MTRSITVDELKAKLAGATKPVVLEALPAKYYDQGHLPGALNFPHDDVDALAPALLPDKAAEIVVYCASDTCRNSRLAVGRLEELGYTNVYEFTAGKKGWIEAGLPVEGRKAAA
ncbi:MAG TPA: rhodanese-like domain-containing protein [Alphaproteobacteria bacterium]|nr:rhodanese-like domain-containing protein [Alphaproteobacteria bacterium]